MEHELHGKPRVLHKAPEAQPDDARIGDRLAPPAFVQRLQRSPGVGALPMGLLRHAGNRAVAELLGGGRPTVQRDVGFEFETKNMRTKQDPSANFPGAGFTDKNAADAAFWAPTAAKVNKGRVLLDRPDIEVQADDAGNDSDLEVVTTHFPETGAGKARLDTAMSNLDTLEGAHDALAQNIHTVPVKALDGQGGFHSRLDSGLIYGYPWAQTTTAPQVTMALRMQHVGNIVEDLHAAPGESLAEATARAPGRLHVRKPDLVNANEPDAISGEAELLANSYALAKATLAAYLQAHPNAPGGAALEGFLTIVYSYTGGMSHKTSFLKQYTPLMAKTDMATIWGTLAPNVQTFYRQKRSGRTHLERLVASAPGYGSRMSKPFFSIPKNAAVEERVGTKTKQWFHKLTLREWLRGIVLEGTDYLTNANFPKKPANREIEGYGARGNITDTAPITGAALPILELRTPSRMLRYDQMKDWALRMFDYVRSLNKSPRKGGNYTKIQNPP